MVQISSCDQLRLVAYPIIYLSNGLNLLHPRKDVAEMVIVFCVSLMVPEDLMCELKSGKHVYQKSLFFVSPLVIVPESVMVVSGINVLV